MRRIIDGTAYDTDTAELIKDLWRDEFGEEAIALYRNRHGDFFFRERFLVPYFDADSLRQEAYVKEDVAPCTVERAREWLEKHDNGLVEQYFGEMPEAGSAERRFTLRMPNNLAKRLETKAGEIPLTRYINRCIERCIGEKGGADAAEERDNAIVLPDVAKKIMARSYQRSGVVAGGTELSSRAKQATVSFPIADFRLLQRAAAKNRVSLSEMVRQLVSNALGAR
jgi:hypothetical protein